MLRHFSFAGMQRCGNHAIINWWMGHFPGYLFRNNILGLTCKHQAAQSDVLGDYHQRIRIDSWENYAPASLTISNHSEPLIVILRDPYNWWASWYRYGMPNPNVQYLPRPQTILWYLKYVEYARSHPEQWVSFNQWFQSDEYRRSLEHRYDMVESDETLEQLPKFDFGVGSTFNAREYDGRAQQMKVLNRWEQVKDDPHFYEPLRANPQLADIARDLFDFEPPKVAVC